MEIIEFAVEKLKPYPLNPRQSNVDALVESLETNGQYRPIVVRKATNEILAGNHLWQAAQKLGWDKVSAVVVDVDEEHAARIVAADNRLADLGTYDDEILLELLEDLPDLTGTGYTQADLDDILAVIEESSTMAEQSITAEQEAHQENIGQVKTIEESISRYAERTVRLLMAEYPNETYAWIQDRLKEVMSEYQLDSNSQAILKAIELATGKTKD